MRKLAVVIMAIVFCAGIATGAEERPALILHHHIEGGPEVGKKQVYLEAKYGFLRHDGQETKYRQVFRVDVTSLSMVIPEKSQESGILQPESSQIEKWALKLLLDKDARKHGLERFTPYPQIPGRGSSGGFYTPPSPEIKPQLSSDPVPKVKLVLRIYAQPRESRLEWLQEKTVESYTDSRGYCSFRHPVDREKKSYRVEITGHKEGLVDGKVELVF